MAHYYLSESLPCLKAIDHNMVKINDENMCLLCWQYQWPLLMTMCHTHTHCLMEEVQGFPRSHWMPQLGEYLHRSIPDSCQGNWFWQKELWHVKLMLSKLDMPYRVDPLLSHQSDKAWFVSRPQVKKIGAEELSNFSSYLMLTTTDNCQSWHTPKTCF